MQVMLNHEETEILLDHLMEVIDERKLGYAKAADKIKDPYLKELFKGHSNQSKFFSQELAAKILGHQVEVPLGHRQSASWRYWIEMKEALKEDTRICLLNACIKGEERTIDIYLEMIKDKHLSQEFRNLLQKQFSQIKQASDLIKIFKIVL